AERLVDVAARGTRRARREKREGRGEGGSEPGAGMNSESEQGRGRGSVHLPSCGCGSGGSAISPPARWGQTASPPSRAFAGAGPLGRRGGDAELEQPALERSVEEHVARTDAEAEGFRERSHRSEHECVPAEHPLAQRVTEGPVECGGVEGREPLA